MTDMVKAQEILDLIDQQGEPVENLSTKVGSLSDKEAEPVGWTDKEKEIRVRTVARLQHELSYHRGIASIGAEYQGDAIRADEIDYILSLFLRPPASREVGDFEPWMVEWMQTHDKGLLPKAQRILRVSDLNYAIATAISRLFEEVEP